MEEITETPVIAEPPRSMDERGNEIIMGARIALVAGVVGVVVIVALDVMGAVVAGLWLPLGMLVVVSWLLPTIRRALFEWEQEGLRRDIKRAWLQSERHRAEGRREETASKLVHIKRKVSEGERATLAVLPATADQDDLMRFVSAVFLRGEKPTARHWIDGVRQLPSGRTYSHEDWQTKFIEPCVRAGLLQPPAERGQSYKALPVPFKEAASRLGLEV